MTPEEYNVLSQLTYLDFGFDGTDTSGTLQEICQRIVDNAGDVTAGVDELNARLNTDYLNAAKAIANGEYPGLSNLTYAGGQNNNDTTGFVGYAFNDGDQVICSFRGSEGDLANVDWRDDFGAGLQGQSVQYSDAVEFTREMTQGKAFTVAGHSKGGNIALYVASQLDNCDGGMVYDGQGFPPGYLTEYDINRLRESGVINYTGDNDVVGGLLVHYEDHRFVDTGKGMLDIAENHIASNIIFDENGNPIPSKQGLISKAAEMISTYAASQMVIATQDEILVPLEEMENSIASFVSAQDHLQGSYKNMERAMDSLERVWSGVAQLAMRYQWHTIYGNISKADEKMEDAINELRVTLNLFKQNEQNVSSSFAALDTGESPFA